MTTAYLVVEHADDGPQYWLFLEEDAARRRFQFLRQYWTDEYAVSEDDWDTGNIDPEVLVFAQCDKANSLELWCRKVEIHERGEYPADEE